jgi:hypothetical protein
MFGGIRLHKINKRNLNNNNNNGHHSHPDTHGREQGTP